MDKKGKIMKKITPKTLAKHIGNIVVLKKKGSGPRRTGLLGLSSTKGFFLSLPGKSSSDSPESILIQSLDVVFIEKKIVLTPFVVDLINFDAKKFCKSSIRKKGKR